MGQEPTPEGGQEPQSTATEAPETGKESKTYDAEYVKGLRREAAGYRTKLTTLEAEVEELKARDMSEAEKLQKERDTLKSEVDPLKGENLRLRVALQKNLPADLVDRLRGSNEEELNADADKLLELFQGQQPTPTEEPVVPSFDGGARPEVTLPPASPEEAHQDFLKEILGRAHST